MENIEEKFQELIKLLTEALDIDISEFLSEEYSDKTFKDDRKDLLTFYKGYDDDYNALMKLKEEIGPFKLVYISPCYDGENADYVYFLSKHNTYLKATGRYNSYSGLTIKNSWRICVPQERTVIDYIIKN